MESLNTKPLPTPSHDVVSTREGYDRWAAIYDGEDNALIALETAQVEEHMGDVRGLAIADIGCGTGRHAIAWAAAGAHVTALDFSDGMLNRARMKAADRMAAGETPGRLDFHVHNLTQPLPLADRSFDRVTCCLVLEHIPDIAALLREMGRICRPDGIILVTELHPAMALRGISARFTDPQTGRETRPASVPKQISDYVMAVKAAGLTLDHISEHAVDESLAARSPRAAKYIGWPMLMVLRMRKQ